MRGKCRAGWLAVVALVSSSPGAVPLEPPAQPYVLRFFDGAHRVYADEPFALALSASFTVEAWFRVERLPAEDTQVLSFYGPGGGGWIGGLNLTAAGEWNLHMPGGGVAGPAVLDEWSHFAACGDGETIAAFVDGSKVADGPLAAFTIASAHVFLGGFEGCGAPSADLEGRARRRRDRGVCAESAQHERSSARRLVAAR